MSVGRFPEGHGVSLLLATSSAQGGSSLLRWDSEHGLDPSDADRYWIGSLDSYHAEVAPSLVPVLSSGNIHPERLLVAVTSLIQSYGVHDNMIEKNVGGAVFGVLTRQGKLEWQGDTDYFLYSQDNTGGISINGFASVVQQDNAVGANSSYINEDRIFISSVSIPKEILRSIRENSWQGWASLISRGLSSVTKENVVFINSMERTITVIHRPNTVNEGNLVRLRYLGGGKYDVAFSQILAEILSKSAKYRQAGAIPFRVNYLTD